MKVWVTRNSAESIMFGGLERLFIHFAKPEWHQIEYKPEERDPSGLFTIGEDQGFYKSYGWVARNKFGIRELSVGNWIGYDEDGNPKTERELARYIWTKLKEHFKNSEFSTWADMEANKEVQQKDFLLEIDLYVGIKNQI